MPPQVIPDPPRPVPAARPRGPTSTPAAPRGSRSTGCSPPSSGGRSDRAGAARSGIPVAVARHAAPRCRGRVLGRAGRPLRGGRRGPGGAHPALDHAALPPRRGQLPRRTDRPGRGPRGRRPARGGRGGRPRPGAGRRVLGWLHPLLTFASGSLIVPVVGTLAGPPDLVRQPGRGGAGLRRGPGRAGGRRRVPRGALDRPGRTCRSGQDGSFPSGSSTLAGETVWGATARMLVELLSSCWCSPVPVTGRRHPVGGGAWPMPGPTPGRRGSAPSARVRPRAEAHGNVGPTSDASGRDVRCARPEGS